ncbi:MAG: calcium-binding protein, partial [Sphingorhabdus sp.]
MSFDFHTFANRVISQYVYGKNSAPTSLTVAEAEALIAERAPKHKANFADENRLNQASHIDISFQDYMDVVGVFASPAQTVLVQKFFELDLSWLLEGRTQATFSKQDIIDAIKTLSGDIPLGLNFTLKDFAFEDDPDYLLRTFIFNSSRFQISNGAQFTIYAGGRKQIDNFYIEPRRKDDGANPQNYENDNFDFLSNSFAAQVTNAESQRVLDPFNLGTTVQIEIGQPTQADLTGRVIYGYTQAEYLRDSDGVEQRTVGVDYAIREWFGGKTELYRSFYDAGAVRYTYDGYNYFLGSPEADNLQPDGYGFGEFYVDWDHLDYQTATPPRARLIGTRGTDLLYGTDHNDDIHGGADNDYLDGGTGSNQLYGGDGNDILIVGAGSNSLTVGGLGRDIINNNSAGGIIWGDVANTFEKDDGTRVYIEGGVEKIVADDASNSDSFEFQAGTTIMDAGKYDRLTFFGLPLTGGDTTMTSVAFAAGAVGGPWLAGGFLGAVGGANLANSAAGNGLIYFDRWMPFITYKIVDNGDGGQDLIVGNVLQGFLDGLAFLTGVDFSNDADAGIVRVKDYDRGGGTAFFGLPGDLGMSFDDFNPVALLSLLMPRLAGVPIAQSVAQALYYQAIAVVAVATAYRYTQYTEALRWKQDGDPLVIDLDGDGIETIGLSDSRAYFDVDGDMFREKTGWLKGDDGFLVLDANGNGRVDDVAEMFGDRTQLGYAELSAYDSNGDGKISVGDGKISVGDLVWSELKVWQDKDRDGETDAGELFTLDELGIRELSLATEPLGAVTPQGTQLLSYGSVTFDTGRVSTMYEAIFASNDTDTRYAGESGRAPWQSASSLNAKGFGTITDLAVATANDVGLAELAQGRAAAMVSPNLRTLVAQAGDVLGHWGMTLETSRELLAVRLSATGELLEHRAWDGQALAAGWSLEQGWSPVTRPESALATMRAEAPYLAKIVDGRAVILDYGIAQADGSWKLASDSAVSYASVADLIAQAPRPSTGSGSVGNGAEWRVEAIQANPLADVAVQEIGVYFINGAVKDYTVRVTDSLGSFTVWARNLDRALQLQAKTGYAYEFDLRNYAVDLATLDEVNSTDDSTYRVELLTPAQFHFATSLGGIDFRKEMLTATYTNATGQLAYSVNGVRGADGSLRSAGRYGPQVDADGQPVLVTYSDGRTEQARVYESDVKAMIGLLQPVMEQYIVTSRRFAVRMALQGGLKPFARGLAYDAASDTYKPTTDRQLAPMFEAIFEDAPASNANDAVLDYLTDWNEILWQVYPDYAPTGAGNLLGAAAPIDQAFI